MPASMASGPLGLSIKSSPVSGNQKGTPTSEKGEDPVLQANLGNHFFLPIAF